MSKSSTGALELAVLLAVVRLQADAYGLAIRRDLSVRMGHDYAVGAIYTTLKRLQDKGLLISHTGEPLPVRGGRARRHYALTSAGSRAIRAARQQAASVWSGIGITPRPERA
jgi:PadR family transcriptional regulator PadR